jgi:hypothetical protein
MKRGKIISKFNYLFCLSLIFLLPHTVLAQSGMKIIKSAPASVSKPLRSLPPLKADLQAPSAARSMQDRQLVIPKTQQAGGGRDASIVQDSPIGMSMPSPSASFEGVDNNNGVAPPDTQGDIGIDPVTGKKYYVQWVNLSFQIWDVSTPASPVSVYGPAAGNTLWNGFGGICESNNDGDPLTMFDHLANRWVMTQFALDFPDNFHECIAVSQTADPTGAWYRYDFPISTTKMNDYPHLGVWPDGYYMSMNQFWGGSLTWAGAGAVVFERTAMLNGAAASMIYFDIGAVNLNYSGMLPSDLDGAAPAAGTPNYFVEWDDSSWLSDPADTLRIWEFKPDWDTPANSTFGLNASYDPNLTITTGNVDPDMCSGARGCISQPGTTNKVDAISDRLMHRLQFRNFGSYTTLVGNHTVDATSADKAGIHWFELRNTGSGFAMNQQGVYSPDTDNRWMGSAAMDSDGNMALGYSVSSAATYPSVRYTGRLAADPLGTLPQGEASMVAGGGSQTAGGNRWGDYSAMSVDPEDDCTFWYTQEYFATTSGWGWQTRIGSFKFPSCTPDPTGILSGTVTNSGAAPIAGVTVEATGGYSTVTDEDGHYSLTLVAGTYTVTASKYGYVTGSVSGVVVTPPATTTQNFALTLKAQVTVSGTVTDGSGAGWPLYATIDISTTGFSTTVVTDPVTGQYSVNLVGTTDFTFTVGAPGYTTQIATVTTGSGPSTRNFSLIIDSSCSAPGYGGGLSENFDSGVTPPALPAGWAVADVSGTAGNWATNAGTSHPSGVAAHSAPNLIYFNSYNATAGNSTRLYRTSGLNLSGVAGISLTFWMYHETGYTSANDRVQVQVSTNGGSSWNDVGSAVSRYNGTTQWTQHTIDISAYTGTGNTDVRIALLATSEYGYDIHIDDVALGSCGALDGGLVAGTVYDANTNLPLSGVTVNSGTSSAVSDSAGVYVVFSSAGTHDVTAIAPKGYGNVTASVSVGDGTVTGQDFYLPAGLLAASPTSLTFDVTAAAPATSKPLALNNSGGRAASYKIFAIPGTFPGHTPTGPFADNTRHTGPKNLNDKDSSKLRVDLTPRGVTPLAAGNVSASWNTGLVLAWGIGFNTVETDLWLGNIAASGGDDLDYRFTTAGVNTGDTIDTATWRSAFAADMTYNPFTNTLWQVNVGGDNCIYELDPATMTSTGNKICPAFGTSERGLAYDPVSDTYYAGSWNDAIINHFAPNGDILDSVNTGLSISGLAFNPGTGHLFVLTNAATTSDPTLYDVYVLNTRAAYANLGGFNLTDGATKAFADNEQAGLEMDCSGNLWAVNQTIQKVFVADSGETGVCDGLISTWLSVTPDNGSVAAAGTAPLTVNVNGAGLTAGTHNAFLRVVNDTPYGYPIVPVTLNVASAPLTLTAPNGGNSWKRNSQQYIRWNAAPGLGSLRISLWQNGTQIGIIADNVNPAAGSYAWSVGAYTGGVAPLGTGYTIRIREKGTAVSDESDAPFSIVKMSVKTPNGGESWQIGSAQNITWSAKSLSGNLRIVLFKNGTKVGNIVNSIDPALGTYAWTAGSYVGGTATAGTGYQVQIREIGTDAGDRSDGPFTLTSP